MTFDDAVNLDDIRRLAKRRLPKIVYDFIEGGVDDEVGLDRNSEAFGRYPLLPHYMVDVTGRSAATTVFGQRFAGPVGIAPTGLVGLFRPGGDLMLAAAARDANLPFIMSTAANASIEDLGRTAPEHGWFQLYPARDRAISADMIRRADAAGLSTLVVTVDVPVSSNRERNFRNGFTRPLKLSLATRLNALRYPRWLAGYLRHGRPSFPNWRPYAGDNLSSEALTEFVTGQLNADLTWDDIARYRELWPRNLVLKGVMHPDDAVQAAALGVDGLIVSNHGARQLDRAPAAVEALPSIARAVGDRLTVMLDSGIRRGSDAVAALCLGARFLFFGRPTLYGAVAGGTEGAARALAIMQNEVDLVLGQIGCPAIDRLGPDFLFDSAEPDRRNLEP